MNYGGIDPMQMMQFYNTDILTQAMRMKSMGMGMNQGMTQTGMSPFGSDGFSMMDNLFERGGSMPSFGGMPFASQRMGYNGGNQGIPGFGGFGGQQQMMQQMMPQMMMMMMMMMQMMQQMGAGQAQQNPYGQQQNPYGQQQNPYGQQGGQTIELQKGQTFTTPGGCQINWKGNTVKVHEPGGGQRDLADGFASASASVDKNGNATASAAAWGNGTAASASASGLYGTAAASAVSGQAKYANKARDWKVWGDPHIQNPDGSKNDFKTKNAMFTLQDGTKVLMCADNPKGTVDKVRITLPGGQMNMQGVDPRQTMVYANDGNKLNEMGTLDKYQNAFPNAGLNQSPYGNQMFPCPFCNQ